MSYTPSFTPQYENGWKDRPDMTTPVIADALNDYDTAIENIENFLGSDEFFKIFDIHLQQSGAIDDGESRDFELEIADYDMPSGFKFFNLLNFQIYQNNQGYQSKRNCLYNISYISRTSSSTTLYIRAFNDYNGDYQFSDVYLTIIACRSDLVQIQNPLI